MGIELLSASTYGASNSTEFNSGSGTPYFNNVSDQKMFPGVAIYETPIASGGITLVGPNKTALILVHPNASTALKQHEYGHYLDMKYGSGTLGILPNDLTFNIANNGIHEFVTVTKDGVTTVFDNVYTKGIEIGKYMEELAGSSGKAGGAISGKDLVEKSEKLK